MNAEQLLHHFERISEAPEAIPRLRRFILDLAVRGKLVEQDSNDEPASELLRQIAAEKAWLVKTGEIRTPKSLAPIQQQPFDPPHGWLWLPLGETGVIQSGNSINAETRNRLEKSESGYPYIATKDVGYGLDPIIYDNGLKVPFEDKSFRHARAGSILICAEGGSAGRKIGITDRDICFGNKLIANAPWSAVVPRLVMYVYMSDFFYDQFVRKMTGVIGGISIQKLLQLPFPLPPLDEQLRIVARVDELMSLCDQLEVAKADREQCRDTLVAASLQGLNQPAGEVETFRDHARFTFNNLSSITTKAAHIKQLRQTVFDLAVRGKLVAQDPSDEPVADLLKQRRKAGGNSKLRRSVPESVALPNHLQPEDLPPNWCLESIASLLRLGAIRDLKDGNHGANHPKVSDFVDEGLPFITAAQVSDSGEIDYEGAYKLAGAPLDKLRVGFAHSGDVIYTHKGSVGRVALCHQECVLSPQTTYYRLDQQIISNVFLRVMLLSRQFRDQVDAVKKQTTRDFVSIQKQYEFFLFLPPLTEQYRIVAKVDELMALCDQLEAQITEIEQDSRRFLEAVLNEALSPAMAEAA